MPLAAVAMVTLCSAGACGGPTTMAPARRNFGAPASTPSALWLVSDPQIHNAAGAATLSKSMLAEILSPTSIRPPSLDLWADAVLAQIVERIRPSAEPVMFLGDAANVSCIGELARFLEVMRPVPWVGVLGNHDGYYMGNMTFRPDAVLAATPYTWQGACHHSDVTGYAHLAELATLETTFLEDLDGGGGFTHVKQRTLTKTHAVWMLLGDLFDRAGAAAARSPWEIRNWVVADGRSYRRYAIDTAIPLAGSSISVAARAEIPMLSPHELARERSRAWQAFVVQDVRFLDGVHALLVDTSDYERTPPTVFRQILEIFSQHQAGCRLSATPLSIPGECGEVSERQVAALRELIAAWPAGTRFFVAGHHPWRALRPTSAARLRGVLERPGFITYVSGHTHLPASTPATDGAEPWEINVGSTTDWPMEYSRLSYWPADTSADDAPVQLELRYADSAVTCPYGQPAAAPDELRYRNTGAYTRRALDVYKALLIDARARDVPLPEPVVAFERDLADSVSWSSDKQRGLLAKLVAFDRRVLRRIPSIAEVEAACAIWASAAECAKEGCAALRGHALGGAEQRTLSFRVPAHPWKKTP